MDALTDGIGNFFSGWFGGKDEETAEKTALSTFATERFKLIETNIQEGSIGHKLKKAQVVLLLDDNQSPLVAEFVKNQFTKKSALISDCRRINQNNLANKCGLNRYRNNVKIFHAYHDRIADPAVKIIKLMITKVLFPQLLSTIYSHTDEEIHQMDPQFSSMTSKLQQSEEFANLPFKSDLLTHSREQRFEFLNFIFTTIAEQSSEIHQQFNQDEINQIKDQSQKLYEETTKTLKKYSKIFVVTDEATGRLVNPDQEAVAAVQNLYQKLRDQNISFVTLKVRKEIRAEPLQSEKDNLSLNDLPTAEHKTLKRVAKLDQAKADLLERAKLTIPETWSLFNQTRSLKKLLATVETPLLATALEFTAQRVSSWELPEQ